MDFGGTGRGEWCGRGEFWNYEIRFLRRSSLKSMHKSHQRNPRPWVNQMLKYTKSTKMENPSWGCWNSEIPSPAFAILRRILFWNAYGGEIHRLRHPYNPCREVHQILKFWNRFPQGSLSWNLYFKITKMMKSVAWDPPDSAHIPRSSKKTFFRYKFDLKRTWEL